MCGASSFYSDLVYDFRKIFPFFKKNRTELSLCLLVDRLEERVAFLENSDTKQQCSVCL